MKFGDYLAYGVVTLVGLVIMMGAWPLWVRSFVDLALVAVGGGIVTVSLCSLKSAYKETRKQ